MLTPSTVSIFTHVEAIAIFTFQSNYHPVKLQKTTRYFPLHLQKNRDSILVLGVFRTYA
ncbi:MAG: hypothetical protein F6K48_33365 [Okeania sp. SIO3H1]|uniref:hypothetical protein n=1 Tax=Okeania sp. SIO1I7 TaxID=2607772 RepID=UPI0013C9D148|nr:hypothetical protein [Okeania sp. SIO1I7]NEN93505.1 hypothetical protein [Okeania sp. SIO3H1]NET28655.1 hypothetical protein [Okeania sp. SIO1I7]